MRCAVDAVESAAVAGNAELVGKLSECIFVMGQPGGRAGGAGMALVNKTAADALVRLGARCGRDLISSSGTRTRPARERCC